MGEEARLLPRFIRFMDERQEAHITARLALEWVQQAHSVQRAERARRLTFVRGSARFRSAMDARTQIPPAGLIPHRSARPTPHLHSDEEIRRLLDAALKLPTPRRASRLRPYVFYCLIGLLSVTGLRISEALNLKLNDVDLSEALLTIRGAKLNRSRVVPIHSSTCMVLAEYLKRRARFFREPISAYVFVSCCGTRLDLGRVHRTFHALSRSVGLREPGASTGPRLHDFRHPTAVQVLTRWYESCEDVTSRLPIPSTYLGHVCISDTYWYLRLPVSCAARLEVELTKWRPHVAYSDSRLPRRHRSPMAFRTLNRETRRMNWQNQSDSRKVRMIAFAVCFFAAGVPFWMIPYSQVTVPNGFFGLGLVVVVVVAAVLGMLFRTRFIWSVLIPGLALPAALMARVIVEGVIDPTRHNLWPLALVIALVLGLAVATPGAVVGWLLARTSR